MMAQYKGNIKVDIGSMVSNISSIVEEHFERMLLEYIRENILNVLELQFSEVVLRAEVSFDIVLEEVALVGDKIGHIWVYVESKKGGRKREDCVLLNVAVVERGQSVGTVDILLGVEDIKVEGDNIIFNVVDIIYDLESEINELIAQ